MCDHWPKRLAWIVGPMDVEQPGEMAAELGPQGIRVNVISPGPLLTRAASGISGFGHLMEEARQRAPLRILVALDDIGTLAAFLVSDLAKAITGGVTYVDGGFNITGD